MKSQILTLVISLIMITTMAQDKNFHSFTVQTINEEAFRLADLKGKKVLVVNTASKCGLTPQYEKLQELYEMYGGDDFTIIGFPANNFLRQEPGTNEEIKSFCQLNYGVSFPMMAKISVKGKNIHPLYTWLTKKSENGVMDAPVKWNFQKFMIDEEGNLVGMIPPKKSPLSDEVTAWIKGE